MTTDEIKAKVSEIREDIECMPNDAKLDGTRFENYCWMVRMIKALLKHEIDSATLIKDLLQELKPYAQARRDTNKGEGWEWHYVEIKHESDYEFYPNHIDKKTIEDFELRIAERDKILGEIK